MGSPTASIYMTLGLAIFSFLMMHGAAVLAMGPIRYVKSLWPHIEIMPMPGSEPHGHGHDDHGHGTAHARAPVSHSTPPPAVPWWHWPLWLLAWLFGLAISLMIFVIEMVGTVIKSVVLALRLFANMFAGHLVLASILLLIVTVGNSSGFGVSWGATTLISVVGVVALSLLELFVAFLQAFVFVFLTALFMGFQLHPSH
jgi:F0F1-type ATP synthase membrane subunit a